MTDLITLDVTIDPKSLARATKTLDRWQGAPLAKRTDRALSGGAKLFAGGLRSNAPADSGGLRRSVRVTRRGVRGSTIASYKVAPTKRVPDKRKTDLLTALLVHGTSRGVEANPFVDRVQSAYQNEILGFVSEQIRRLE